MIKTLLLIAVSISATTTFAKPDTQTSGHDFVQKLAYIDCRKGDHFFGTDKGFKIDLGQNTMTSYTENSKVTGDGVAIQCALEEASIHCQGEGFVITLPDYKNTETQRPGRIYDSAGLFDGRPWYTSVTRGELFEKGLLFDSISPLTCKTDVGYVN